MAHQVQDRLHYLHNHIYYPACSPLFMPETLHSISCLAFVCSFPVSAHVSVLAASRLPLQLFGTPFLWPFAVVFPLTVFGANSIKSQNFNYITQFSGLLNAPLHPAPQTRRVSRCAHCALYKFIYLLKSLISGDLGKFNNVRTNRP